MERVKKLISKVFGKVPKENHVVVWRKKITIDGIFWEKVHHPLEKRD